MLFSKFSFIFGVHTIRYDLGIREDLQKDFGYLGIESIYWFFLYRYLFYLFVCYFISVNIVTLQIPSQTTILPCYGSFPFAICYPVMSHLNGCRSFGTSSKPWPLYLYVYQTSLDGRWTGRLAVYGIAVYLRSVIMSFLRNTLTEGDPKYFFCFFPPISLGISHVSIPKHTFSLPISWNEPQGTQRWCQISLQVSGSGK